MSDRKSAEVPFTAGRALVSPSPHHLLYQPALTSSLHFTKHVPTKLRQPVLNMASKVQVGTPETIPWPAIAAKLKPSVEQQTTLGSVLEN